MNNIVKDIWECRVCDGRYEEYHTDKANKDLHKYIRYLGICGKDCWNKIKPKKKDLIMLRACITNDDRKINNIKIPKDYYK